MVAEALRWRLAGRFVRVPSLTGRITLSYLPLLSYTDVGRAGAECLAAEAGSAPYQIRVLVPEAHDFLDAEPVTMRLPLRGRGVADVWSGGLSGKCRNQVRKAERNGVRVVVGTDGGGLRHFHGLLASSLHFHGAPLPPLALFERMCSRLDAVPYLAYAGDDPVAALIVIRDGGLTWVPFAASDRRRLSMCPNHLLYWRAISDAVESAADVFDFGRSPFLGNTYRFKRQWGARPVGLQSLPPRAGGPYDKYAWAQRMWRATPRPFADKVGPWLCHYLADY